VRVTEVVRVIADGRFSWIETQVFAPDVTVEQYRAAYRDMRRQWSQAARQPLRADHDAILKAVARHGPPPSKYDLPYWTKVRSEAMAQIGTFQFPSYRACAQAYWRIQERLRMHPDALA
jgi:hypothetical protein